jgi:hypothetical protein
MIESPQKQNHKVICRRYAMRRSGAVVIGLAVVLALLPVMQVASAAPLPSETSQSDVAQAPTVQGADGLTADQALAVASLESAAMQVYSGGPEWGGWDPVGLGVLAAVAGILVVAWA